MAQTGTRDLGAGNNYTESIAPENRPVWFVAMFFDGGTTRLNSTDHDITWGGDTYLGAGDLGAIDPIQESSDLQLQALRLSLTGVPNTYISLALGEDVQGRKCVIYKGYLDGDTFALVGDPFVIWRGRLNTMSIREEPRGDSGEVLVSVQVTAESSLADWNRGRARRYTNEDQQKVWAGAGLTYNDNADLGFEFVTETAEKEIRWGN